MDNADLMRYGIDFDRGMINCMSNFAFYKKIMSMFLDDPCFSKAKLAYAEGRQRDLFSLMHELKGVTGNAGLMELYRNTIPLVELLRGGGSATEAEIAPLFAAVEASYNRACEGIRQLLAE